MSGAYGVSFPTAGTPYPTAGSYGVPSPTSTQQQVQIQPGSITYTTSTTSDGQIQYNQFRAEARSYQTPQGLVHGIQWIPVNVSYELPPNAQPAGPDFHASWGRSGNDKEAQRALKDWQREQEKRVKKEERDSAKRMKEWEKERREREKAEEKELRRLQERDLQRGRPRRLSDAGYGVEYPTYSAPSGPGYSRARSRSRVRGENVSQEDITRAMAEMAMDNANDWGVSEQEEIERLSSRNGRSWKLPTNERPRRISTHEYERSRRTSGTPYPTAAYLAGSHSAYGGPPSPGRGYSDRRSPYMGSGGLPPTSMAGPVYPEGHIYAGKPIPGGQGMISSYRAPSPSLGRSPAQMELPISFTRPPSLAVQYTYFEPIMIIPDLNSLIQRLPPMPAVLAPHDVWPEDWMQCFEDIARVWLGKWPERKATSRKPPKFVAELIDLWNASFFSLRGVEMILSHGRQRVSGPQAGRYEDRFRNTGSSDDDSDTISSVSSDSEIRDKYEFYGSSKSRSANGLTWLTDSREARRARKANKIKQKQKKRERREREREGQGSRYNIRLFCIGDGQPPRLMQPAGYSSHGYPI